jgi:AhpD family alkylhydroperoxidase
MLDKRTRLAPMTVERCAADLRAVLDEQCTAFGAPLYPYLLYARHPPYFRAAHAMWAALQEQATRVPGALRALVNRRVAWWNRCEYCQDAHAAKGSRLGLSAEKIEALGEYAGSTLFTEAEKIALEYADAVTDTSRDVDDTLFRRLQQHYDDDTIAELTMIIAWQNASSRFNHAFRIPSQGFWKR